MLRVGILFGFPALAIAAWRTGSSRRLVAVTAGTMAFVAAYALLAASSWFGNQLAATHGYAAVAVDSLVLALVTLGTPIVLSAIAVSVFSRDRIPFWALYASTVGAAALGWVAGTFAATWIL